MIRKWYSDEEDRMPSRARFRVTGGKWFDVTKDPPLHGVEMEVRSEINHGNSQRIGELFITSTGPGDLDGIVTVRMGIEEGYAVD